MKKASDYLILAILAFILGGLQYGLYRYCDYIECYCMPCGQDYECCVWYYCYPY
ncbi:hypothetical protein ACLI09_15775 [Flavobacterium sp. RHBU_24]|uniref:hypothetical protein n=1 Tax=Flavobacterium sp. RHBU_24 TaxID=3391185 RepID=UPI003984A4C7